MLGLLAAALMLFLVAVPFMEAQEPPLNIDSRQRPQQERKRRPQQQRLLLRHARQEEEQHHRRLLIRAEQQPRIDDVTATRLAPSREQACWMCVDGSEPQKAEKEIPFANRDDSATSMTSCGELAEYARSVLETDSDQCHRVQAVGRSHCGCPLETAKEAESSVLDALPQAEIEDTVDKEEEEDTSINVGVTGGVDSAIEEMAAGELPADSGGVQAKRQPIIPDDGTDTDSDEDSGGPFGNDVDLNELKPIDLPGTEEGDEDDEDETSVLDPLLQPDIGDTMNKEEDKDTSGVTGGVDGATEKIAESAGDSGGVQAQRQPIIPDDGMDSESDEDSGPHGGADGSDVDPDELKPMELPGAEDGDEDESIDDLFGSVEQQEDIAMLPQTPPSPSSPKDPCYMCLKKDVQPQRPSFSVPSEDGFITCANKAEWAETTLEVSTNECRNIQSVGARLCGCPPVEAVVGRMDGPDVPTSVQRPSEVEKEKPTGRQEGGLPNMIEDCMLCRVNENYWDDGEISPTETCTDRAVQLSRTDSTSRTCAVDQATLGLYRCGCGASVSRRGYNPEAYDSPLKVCRLCQDLESKILPDPSRRVQVLDDELQDFLRKDETALASLSEEERENEESAVLWRCDDVERVWNIQNPQGEGEDCPATSWREAVANQCCGDAGPNVFVPMRFKRKGERRGCQWLAEQDTPEQDYYCFTFGRVRRLCPVLCQKRCRRSSFDQDDEEEGGGDCFRDDDTDTETAATSDDSSFALMEAKNQTCTWLASSPSDKRRRKFCKRSPTAHARCFATCSLFDEIRSNKYLWQYYMH